MRVIVKGREPDSLTTYRLARYGPYDDYPDKDVLRLSLAVEQRGLCCYCMGPIRPDANAMKIEHWRSQTRYPKEQLNYRNLLGACLGGEGQPFRSQHCDTRKGDTDLLWNPADPAHGVETRIRYELDGTIRSEDAAFDSQLNEVLNLNLDRIRKHRETIFDAVGQWWKKEKAKRRGPVPRDRIERKRNKYMAAVGELTPYCQVVIWLLNQKLARMPR